MQETSTKFAKCDTIEKTKAMLCAEFLELSPEKRNYALAYIKALKTRKEPCNVFPK